MKRNFCFLFFTIASIFYFLFFFEKIDAFERTFLQDRVTYPNPKIQCFEKGDQAVVGKHSRKVVGKHPRISEEERDYGKAIYFYSENGNVLAIEQYVLKNSLYSLYSVEKFVWNKGLLVCQRKEDALGNIYYCQVFTYDERAQLVKETLYGDLSGSVSRPLVIGKDGLPIEKTGESYCRYYTYSDDGKLLEEREDNNKIIRYVYREESNLLQGRFICDGDSILIRYFYDYDEKGRIIQAIHDDGVTFFQDDLFGVTERRIVVCSQEDEGVELVREKYLERSSGKELLFRMIRNTYSPSSCLIRQDIFDSHEKQCYSIYAEYDSAGRLLQKKGPLGNIEKNLYDEKGRKVFSQHGRLDCWIEYSYSDDERVIWETRKGKEGQCSNVFTFDSRGQKIAESKNDGEETRFFYDEFGRLIEQSFPEVFNEHASLISPSRKFEYDICNGVIVEEDEKGYCTKKRYNCRGKEIEIVHPDGGIERFEYYLDGNLRKAVGKNGVYALYFYDVLSRLLKTEVYSADHELFSRTQSTYTSFHMQSFTDVLGNTIYYEFNGLGQQIAIIEKAGEECRKTEFEYDVFGHLYEKREWFDKDRARITLMERDYLGRVIEQTVEGIDKQVCKKKSYKYDGEGNCISLTTYINEEIPQTRLMTYNFLNELCSVVDSLGNETVVIYRHGYKNSRGQRVLQKVTTDALGFTLEETMDALNRQESSLRKSPCGKLLEKKEFTYDAVGNKAKVVEFIVDEGRVKGSRISFMKQYGPLNRLEKSIESYGSPEQKLETYVYGDWGELCFKVNPGGVKLCYEYDKLGRVKAFYSSDKTLFYEYQYNTNHQITQVVDHVNQTTSYRSYDGFSRMTEETLANGLKLQYEYDSLGRTTYLGLPDRGGIQYCYNATDLVKVSRRSTSKKQLYEHTYLSRDFSGNPMKERLIDGKTLRLTKRGFLGDVESINCPFWSEELSKDSYDALGNLHKMRVWDFVGKVECLYSYDEHFRIQEEKGVEEHCYFYDSFSNRIEKDGKRGSVNSLNQLQCDGNFLYHYDLCGNLIRKETAGKKIDYCYDALGRLIEAREEKHLRVRYCYDTFNRRMSKSLQRWDLRKESWESMGEHLFFYEGKKEIGATEKSGKVVELRVLGSGLGAEIGASVAIELDGVTYIPQHDHRGNITCLVDLEKGNVCETYRYSAFGEQFVFDDKACPIEMSKLGNPWGFSSKRIDVETGLLYFGERYYDPFLGRWISPDPAGFLDGLNLYLYTQNGPLTQVDLYGHYSINQTLRGMFDVVCQYAKKSWDCSSRKVKSSFSSFREACSGVYSTLNKPGYFYNLLYDDVEVFSGIVGNGELNSKVRITFINGANSRIDDCLAISKYISDTHGNINVHYVCNPTLGLLTDMWGSIFETLGMKTKASFDLASLWKRLIEEMNNFEEGRIIHYAHSRGGLTTANAKDFLTPEERGSIEVRTVGTVYLISDGDFDKVTNYVSIRDAVPMLSVTSYLESDPFGCLHAAGMPVEDNNTVFLGEWHDGFPFVDHMMTSETYKKLIRMLGEEFMEEYGRLSL